MDDTCLAVE